MGTETIHGEESKRYDKKKEGIDIILQETKIAEYQKPEHTVLLENINLADVTLLDAFLFNAEKKCIGFLLELDPQRFLYNWYRTSGLEPVQKGYENSWERTNDINFRGHMFGHYMSALAQAYAAAKDKEMQSQLLNKMKGCVNGVRTCQKAYAEKYPDRAGYAAPFTEYWLNQLDGVDSGAEAWNQKEKDNPSTYVPWYNLHKIIAGLIDVYKNVKAEELGEAALGAVCGLVDYIYHCRVSKYTLEQKKNMLTTEYGGMAEALYELYRLTGKQSYRECADGFIETSLFQELAADKDVLAGKHANTTIPKFIGGLKKYTVLTQNKGYYDALTAQEQQELPIYLSAAKNFFDIVLSGHSFVTGGNSVEEHFRAANTAASFYQRAQTHETCNEYNMLKLARELFRLTNDKKYADYYERTFINAILASQHPETGEMTYFQPMGAGYSKVFNKSRFWCCTGTGIESFTKLGDSIYFKKGKRIYVNMYFHSELKYSECNLVLRTKANLPNSERIELTADTDGNGEIAAGTTLYLRIPDWCAGIPGVKRNGQDWTAFSMSGGYIVVDNIKKGDRIDLVFPMEVTVSSLEDNENIVAFKYGPAVLAARLGQRNTGQSSGCGVMVLQAVQDTSLPTSIILNNSSACAWKKRINKNFVRIEDTDDGEVQFKAKGTYLADDITFTPYYTMYHCRYGLYMNLAPADSPEMTEKILADKKELRNAEAASACLSQMDGNNYEAAYGIQKSEDSRVGAYNGRNYRDARGNGWFSYDMPVVQGVQNMLHTVYAAADYGRIFQILINGEDFVTETITSVEATSPDGFYTKTREIPKKYTERGKGRQKEFAGTLRPYITVKFQSNGGIAGGLYGISVTHGFDKDPTLSGLSFSVGRLSPEFDPEIKEYTLTVPAGTKETTMKAAPIKKSGLVYDGDILIDDTQSRTVPLSGEGSVLTLTVYAQDHETNTQYIIHIVSERK